LLLSELTKETHFRKISKHHQPVAIAQTSSIRATSNSNGRQPKQKKKKPIENYDVPSQEHLKSKESSTTSDRVEVLLLTTNKKPGQ
jgi:anti-sigma28 factor (negative regulator of flagellin synthesis)